MGFYGDQTQMDCIASLRLLLIYGFDYWLWWEKSLLTYKTINIDQIFRRDGRDALTNVPLCSLTKRKTEYEILHKCLIKGIKKERHSLLTWEASPVAIVNAPRRARAALFVCVELGNGGEQRPKAGLVFANASAPSLKRRDCPQATRGVIDDWQPLQGYKSDAAKRGGLEQGLGLWSWLAPRASVSER